MGRVEKLKETLTELHQHLRTTVDGVAREDEQALHWKQDDETWSVAQILAHVAEFQHFFGQDVKHLQQNPGAQYGRTVEHADRLNAVRLSGTETGSELWRGVSKAKEEVFAILGEFSDTDLDIVGTNPKFGHQTIGWVIGHFITEHIEKHIGQIQRVHKAYRAATNGQV